MNNDFSACIEPANVIRGRAHDFNFRIGIAHGTGSLARVPKDADMGFFDGIPEPATDAVLAKGLDFQITTASFYVLVYNFFQHPGGNPLVFSLA